MLMFALRFLQRALQWVLILLCKIHHLRHFGLGDFIGEDSANADAFLVNMQHHPRGLFGIHLKKCFQHMDDKFHRRVIVVEQQHLILAGLFRFRARAGGKADAGASAAIIIFIIAAAVWASDNVQGVLKLHESEIEYRGASPQEGIMR